MDLSIVICTYQNREFLRVCLGSVVERVKDVKYEVLVVDNASTDGTVEMVRAHYPETTVIENPVNRGVARARNQGIRRARGRSVLLLDADTELLSSDMAGLLTFMDGEPSVALLGVKQLNFEERPYPAARTFPTVRNIVANRLGFLPVVRDSALLQAHLMMRSEPMHPVAVDYLIGSFQLIRRDVFAQVGFLDEKMFWGFEDADFCARIRRAGHRCVYYPGFTIKHYVQARTRRQLLSRTGAVFLARQIRSYARFYRKHCVLLARRELGLGAGG